MLRSFSLLLPVLVLAAPLAVAAPSPSEPSAPHPGAEVYAQHCAQCHEGAVPKAPHKMFLQLMAPDAILHALDDGVMRMQASGLSSAQRRAVAEYLSGTTVDSVSARPKAPQCTGDAARFDLQDAPEAQGWGFDRGNTRYLSPQAAGMKASDLPRLKLKWSFAYPGAQRARSQPTLALGAVFVGSQDGTVYALDRRTGCVRWTFRASAEVRTPVIVAPWSAGADARPVAYFADLIARVYAVDALTGKPLWSIKADDHPNATVTGAPALHDGRLYVPVSSLEVTSAADPKYACCSFRGALLALNAADGQTAWKAFTIPEPPREVARTSAGTAVLAPSGAPVWNSPTIDAKRGVIYVGTGENYSSPAGNTSDALIAYNLVDGKLLWVRQKTTGDAWNVGCMVLNNPNCPPENGPDLDFGAGTLLAQIEGRKPLILAGQKSGDVFALDPAEAGAELWRRKLGRGGIQGGVHFGMALEGRRLYVPISDMLDEHVEGKVYTEASRAGLYALDAFTGKVLWSTPADNVCKARTFCEPGISAAITAVSGGVIAGHMDGRLRGYDGRTGKVIWEFDTARQFTTVSGEVASGGSMGGSSGPVAHAGMLFANSGYGMYWHMPGNVLLAFTLE